MYYTGTGLTRDYSEAARWVRMAAEQGYARAQLDLAYLYEQGKGVPVDYTAAYIWYKAALSRGEKRAGAQLKSLSSVMSQGQIQRANRMAAELSRSPSLPNHGTSSEAIDSLFGQKR
jgi:TPR repeat protein